MFFIHYIRNKKRYERSARIFFSLVKYRDEIRGEGRYQGDAPLSSGHVLVIITSQLRRILVYIHGGQQILQTDYVAEVEDPCRFVRSLVVRYIPKKWEGEKFSECNKKKKN